MLTSIKFWNEPNNVSHWDFELDREWRLFGEMALGAARRVRSVAPDLTLVMGGLSPIDPRFLRLMRGHGVLEQMDVLAVHGFPLDWNLWPIEQWPEHLAAIRQEFDRPVWVTETGVSSFADEGLSARGLTRSQELLAGERVYWYTLLDLDPTVEATTRHKAAEGSGYFRHFHHGLLRHDGTPKAALDAFDGSFGICQWFQFEERAKLPLAVRWLERLGVRHVRTGLSWAESHMPGGWQWFDEIMDALAPFDVCATLCFTPPSRGVREHHTSPPRDLAEFGQFAEEVVRRYAHQGAPGAQK